MCAKITDLAEEVNDRTTSSSRVMDVVTSAVIVTGAAPRAPLKGLRGALSRHHYLVYM